MSVRQNYTGCVASVRQNYTGSVISVRQNYTGSMTSETELYGSVTSVRQNYTGSVIFVRQNYTGSVTSVTELYWHVLPVPLFWKPSFHRNECLGQEPDIFSCQSRNNTKKHQTANDYCLFLVLFSFGRKNNECL